MNAPNFPPGQPNHLEEHLNTLERQIVAAKEKLAPLGERTVKLNQHADAVRKQLSDLATILGAFEAEIAVVEKEIAGLSQVFDGVAQGLGQVRAEAQSEAGGTAELAAAHERITSMFSEAFPVVSRFFDTAKKLGLVAKDHSLQAISNLEAAVDSKLTQHVEESIPVAEPIAEPVAEQIPEPVVESLPTAVEHNEPEIAAYEHAAMQHHPVEHLHHVVEEPAEHHAVKHSVPEIPTLADIDAALGKENDAETPVHLPPLPDVSVADEADNADSDAVEAMLADLSKPIST